MDAVLTMTHEQIYQRVLDQLLDAGVSFVEAARIAKAQADELVKMDAEPVE